MTAIKRNGFLSILKRKCPKCREGEMYTQKGFFPLQKIMDMPEHCPKCGQKYELEPGFWYGTGYMSYALSVGSIITITTLYFLLGHFSWKDNSIYKLIGLIIGSMIVLQPFIMRYSRVLYLYFFVRYDKNAIPEK